MIHICPGIGKAGFSTTFWAFHTLVESLGDHTQNPVDKITEPNNPRISPVSFYLQQI
jgi:hypothetical protein